MDINLPISKFLIEGQKHNILIPAIEIAAILTHKD